MPSILGKKYIQTNDLIVVCGPTEKGKKQSPVHKWFLVPNVLIHKDLKNHVVCSVCRGNGKNKVLSVRNGTTSTLIRHLESHEAEYGAYLTEISSYNSSPTSQSTWRHTFLSRTQGKKIRRGLWHRQPSGLSNQTYHFGFLRTRTIVH